MTIIYQATLFYRRCTEFGFPERALVFIVLLIITSKICGVPKSPVHTELFVVDMAIFEQ